MKKVLIFSLAYYPRFVGGAEVAVKEVTDRVRDIAFHMVTLRFDSRLPRVERIGNVTIHRVGWGKPGAVVGTSYGLRWLVDKILFIPLAALQGYRLHRLHRFDGFWAMMTYMVLPIALLRLCGVRVPYALTLQDGDPFEYVFQRRHIRPFLPLLRYGFRHAAVIQTISHFLSEWARRLGYRGPLEVIPNGVDTKHFAGQPLPHEGVVLVTTSRLVRKNAIDDVLRALPLVPGVRFVILGSGPDEAALRELAAQSGVAERVAFLGYVGHADLPRHLHSADIFIRPSRSEGMGSSFIEAMAAGLPVIATQEGGLRDFILPTTAWVVQKDRPDQIALQIKAILDNPRRAREIAEHARELAVEGYDWDLLSRAMRDKVFARLFT